MIGKVSLNVIELCSGIGAQVKGINNTTVFSAKSICTADLDKEVVVSYAAIHCGLTKELVERYDEYPTKEEMIQELTDKRIGYDFKKDKPYDWLKLSKKKDKNSGIEKYWLATHLSHNLGDMMKIEYLPDCDLLTYSTPCTDLSVAGKQDGLKWTCSDCGKEYDPSTLNVDTRYTCPNCGSHNIKSTRSGLMYEVERLLVKAKDNNNLPKYLLMENVDALVSKKYINSFYDWIERLDTLGYNSYYQTINAKDTGIPQNRNRIFCISILKEIDTKSFVFPKPFDLGIRLKNYLDDNVDKKYYLSDEICARIQAIAATNNQSCIARKITPRECHRLMGFSDTDYDKCEAMGILNSQGYKQAGNSIATTCITLLMEHLYQAQYDNTYVCFDEAVNNLATDNNQIIVVGNYMPSNHDASRIVDEIGIAPCVKENHGTVTGIFRRNFTRPQVE